MTHDPTKGCYTLDTLRALNPLYDHEHGLTQQDVEAVNAMKKYIESTRSADRPQCGDRVRYVSRHGDYAGSALIAYDRNDMLTRMRELYAAEDRRREQVRIERENDDSGKRKRG